jgi:hypothetical protein
VFHELREDGLAGVHRSLSAIGPASAMQAETGILAYDPPGKKLKSKNPISEVNVPRCYRLAEIQNCCPGQ